MDPMQKLIGTRSRKIRFGNRKLLDFFRLVHTSAQSPHDSGIQRPEKNFNGPPGRGRIPQDNLEKTGHAHKVGHDPSATTMLKQTYAAALMATLFWSSSQSAAGTTGPLDIPDKWAHLLAYGLLGTLYLRIPWFRKQGRNGVWLAVLAASLYGASDEYHQYFVPGRVCDWVDWVADTLGALLAAWLYAAWTPYRNFLEFPLFPRRKKPTKEQPQDG